MAVRRLRRFTVADHVIRKHHRAHPRERRTSLLRLLQHAIVGQMSVWAQHSRIHRFRLRRQVQIARDPKSGQAFKRHVLDRVAVMLPDGVANRLQRARRRQSFKLHPAQQPRANFGRACFPIRLVLILRRKLREFFLRVCLGQAVAAKEHLDFRLCRRRSEENR